MKVVEVKWYDAEIRTDDMPIKDAAKIKPPVRTTIGWLVAEKPEWLILATDKFQKGKEISAPMIIPTGMIIDWWEYV